MNQPAASQAEPQGVPDFVAINRVRVEKAADFEEWLRSVVTPAVQTQQPHQIGRWRVLRAREADGDTVVFAFVFYGGAEEDWDLESLLTEALGPEEARKQLSAVDSMCTGEQAFWAVDPVTV
jgi:hypothetical protein